MITIDKLCYNSKLRYVNAGEKFAFAMLTLIACVGSRSIAAAAFVLLATGILTVYKGGIPLFRYLHFLKIPLAFLLLSTLAIMFNLSHTPGDLISLPLGSWYLSASREDLAYAFQLIATALGAVSCLYFLSFNTPMPDILDVLRAMHCPRLIIELMLLIYRFIFVLLEISSAISTSQKSRLGNINYKTSLKSFGALASALFIRAMKKSNALYDAMESRCYMGTIHVLSENYPPRKKEVLYIVVFEILLYAFAIWRKFFL
ncbi:MAG: cobalt ECF transporter T component CbiQ [Eubacteriales bacterium]|nr:cobalt ECF transporter T component CbiQ [Eubacteriales bacterium]